MLHQTFCHIPGIGLKTERRLWEAGILSWEGWRNPPPFPLANSRVRDIPVFLEASRQALDSDRPNFFTPYLAAADIWRIFPHFRARTAFIDIETTGLDADARITTIALYDGSTVRTYVNGRNLDDFVADIFAYTVLVSYNGKGFDVPFLERHFRIRLDHAHIDLRYVLARLGLKGGLKGCEKQLGIDRGSLDGVDGFFAVLLWREYERTGSDKALETLLAYNIEDTVNLERLLVEAYNRNIAVTPFARKLAIPAPEPACIPYRPDMECVERLRRAALR
ncbi:MAG: ribonuclease H-like domain-containing protein [Desulfocapsaceae bacterium]|nr:ribonuclease H-like domain-containing protein [Desulfocapsaceae bacterium]